MEDHRITAHRHLKSEGVHIYSNIINARENNNKFKCISIVEVVIVELNSNKGKNSISCCSHLTAEVMHNSNNITE